MKVRRQYSLIVEEEAHDYQNLKAGLTTGTPIYIGQTTRLLDFWDPRDGKWLSVLDNEARFHQLCDEEAKHDERYR